MFLAAATFPAKLAARWKRVPLFWQFQAVGWTGFAFIDLANRQLTYHSFPISLAMTLAVSPLLVLLSTGLARLYDHFMPDARLTARSILAILVLASLSASVVVALVWVIRTLMGWNIPYWLPLEQAAVPFIHYGFVLSGWSVLYFWIRAQLREQAASARAMAAQAEALHNEVQHLRLQLDPHFLFNALNGVAEEIPEHPRAALAMLRDLTAYLRHSLMGIDQPVVPVDAEVDSLRAYLRIQEARFGAKLTTRLTLDPKAALRPIANFLLQPLVENAVKYGARTGVLEVSIDIRAVERGLRVVVINTGSLEGNSARKRGRGVGLKNLRRRLEVHYPARHAFRLDELPSDTEDMRAGRVIATLVLEGEPC